MFIDFTGKETSKLSIRKTGEIIPLEVICWLFSPQPILPIVEKLLEPKNGEDSYRLLCGALFTILRRCSKAHSIGLTFKVSGQPGPVKYLNRRFQQVPFKGFCPFHYQIVVSLPHQEVMRPRNKGLLVGGAVHLCVLPAISLFPHFAEMDLLLVNKSLNREIKRLLGSPIITLNVFQRKGGLRPAKKNFFSNRGGKNGGKIFKKPICPSAPLLPGET